MKIDEGAFLVLRSATGAFSCRTPPLPKDWNPIDRPHVAILIPSIDSIFRVFLSNPVMDEQRGSTILTCKDMDSLPVRTVVEVKKDSVDYEYYRKDPHMWTKVGEGQHPFLIEVYSHGVDPIIITTEPDE
jgi:hypothetical protein